MVGLNWSEFTPEPCVCVGLGVDIFNRIGALQQWRREEGFRNSWWAVVFPSVLTTELPERWGGASLFPSLAKQNIVSWDGDREKIIRILTIHHWSELETNILHKIIHQFAKGINKTFFSCSYEMNFSLPPPFLISLLENSSTSPYTTGCRLPEIQLLSWHFMSPVYQMVTIWSCLFKAGLKVLTSSLPAWYSLIRVAKETGGWFNDSWKQSFERLHTEKEGRKSEVETKESSDK